MSSLNRATIIGNLGADPTVRETNGGKTVANFSVATSQQWKDKTTGEKREATEWHSVVVWDALATIVQRFAHKGSKVYIDGKLRTRKYEDQGGITRYVTEIIADEVLLLDRRPATATLETEQPAQP